METEDQTIDEINDAQKESHVAQQDNVDKEALAENEYLALTQEFYDNISEFVPSSRYPKSLDKPLVFYKTVLALSEKGKDVNTQINRYLEAEQSEKNEIRTRLITAYWSFIDTLFANFEQFTDELRYLLRYGMLVTSAVSGNIFKIIKSIDIEEESSVSIYYIDEWLQKVSNAEISQTVLDETSLTAEGMLISEQRKLTQIEEQQARFTSDSENLSTYITELLRDITTIIQDLENRPLIEGLEIDIAQPLRKDQIQMIRTIREKLNLIQQNNEELETRVENINSTISNIEKSKSNINAYKDQTNKNKPKSTNILDLDYDDDEEEQEFTPQNINNKVVFDELKAVRQMMKGAVGKRGNHFPIIMKDFFSGPTNAFGTRQAVLEEIKKLESIDYTIFKRVIKNHVHRFFPLVVLGPCYSSTGICWEPFEMSNRNNSSAKILIPMYSQNLNKAITHALGDYRWQYAKEKAGYTWMEEGLTGDFYLWFQNNIKKGDVKAAFIEQYAIWIKWESTGAQKLDKELRFIFWKYVPFSHALKKTLSERSTVYAEMLRKEMQMKARQNI